MLRLFSTVLKNAANQIIKTEQFLPIVSSDESEPLSDYIFEPSMEQIVSSLFQNP